MGMKRNFQCRSITAGEELKVSGTYIVKRFNGIDDEKVFSMFFKNTNRYVFI